VSDRKYRQQGYRQGSSERRDPPRPRPASTEVPRGSMLDKRTLSRCAACGAVLPIAHASLTECPSCRAALHACRQCTHFEPTRRFECTQPIVERIADKSARNECDGFALRVTVERDASPDGPRPDDLRRSFNNLFKK
jgi:predicted RNA-binding Zn-ribbon protein involved in translation (DUF1610 family)